MKHLLIILPVLLSVCSLSVCSPSLSLAAPLRAVCVVGGVLDEYGQVLRGLVQGLVSRGLLEVPEETLRQRTDSAEELWRKVAESGRDGRVRFLADGFYSAAWQESGRETIRVAVQERLETRQDVDLILAVGTWAGQDMAGLETSVPVLVCATSDARAAGIIRSETDSGRDNLSAVVEPTYYERQLLLFHTLFGFRRMGFAYEDTPTGRSMAAYETVMNFARIHGIGIVPCNGDFHAADRAVRYRDQMACTRHFLSEHVDAVYLAYQVGDLAEHGEESVLDPLNRACIPTFSQTGSQDVKNGALLGMASTAFHEGLFHAQRVEEIMKGRVPRSLSQIFQRPVRIALNLHTATIIGWNPPLDFLIQVDEFF